jgi:hypothetical protein
MNIILQERYFDSVSYMTLAHLSPTTGDAILNRKNNQPASPKVGKRLNIFRHKGCPGRPADDSPFGVRPL